VTGIEPERIVRGGQRTARRQDTVAWLLIIPALLVAGGVSVYPLLRTLYLSFFDAPLIAFARPARWAGLGNYAQALQYAAFRDGIAHTLYFTVLSVGAELVLGVVTALLLNQRFRGRASLRALLILPLAIPTVVNATMWRWIYNPEYGALNALLTQLRLAAEYRSWLGEEGLAMNMVILADVWKNYPLVTLIVLAALQSINRDLYEAAAVDGAGAWRAFWSITLPALRPALLVVTVLRTVEAMKVFDIIYVMTRGGPADSTKTLSFYVYQEAFAFLRLGSGAAYAFLTLVLIAVFVVLYIRLIRAEAVTA